MKVDSIVMTTMALRAVLGSVSTLPLLPVPRTNMLRLIARILRVRSDVRVSKKYRTIQRLRAAIRLVRVSAPKGKVKAAIRLVPVSALKAKAKAIINHVRVSALKAKAKAAISRVRAIRALALTPIRNRPVSTNVRSIRNARKPLLPTPSTLRASV